MLHSQHNLSHTRLQQFEYCVLGSHGRAGVVNSQDLVPRLDSAIQEGSLVLHHVRHVDTILLRRLLNEKA